MQNELAALDTRVTTNKLSDSNEEIHEMRVEEVQQGFSIDNEWLVRPHCLHEIVLQYCL